GHRPGSLHRWWDESDVGRDERVHDPSRWSWPRWGPLPRQTPATTPVTVGASKSPMGGATSTECRAAPGEFAPVIDRAKCEGKADCVRVCPYSVFEVRRIDDADFAKLGPFGKLKSVAHGRK